MISEKRTTMTTAEILDEILEKAKRDPALKARILEMRKADAPLAGFCGIARGLGYDLYPMDVIGDGEAAYAAMKRSTNGGGENSPMLEGSDDLFEMFLAMLD